MRRSRPDAARGPPPPLEGPEDAATEPGPSRSAAAPEENRHPPLCPPTSRTGPGGAALPSQLHPSPLEPSLSLVPSSARGGGPECVGGGDKTPLPVHPRPPFGDHTPPSPQSSVASSGSKPTEEPAGGRNTFQEEGSGMKDVPSWLKSLGLQKYTALFSQMTYEEMMTLTEHQLESQNVPRSARQRILLSIQNLRERPNILMAMETRIIWGGSLWMVMQELQQIIVTPIKAFRPPPAAPHPDDTSDGAPPGATNTEAPSAPVPDGDIPGQFTRVMGKVCAQLLESWPNKENIISYLDLLEQCLSHEAFTETQKRRLLSWWWQVQRVLRTFPIGADQQLAPGPARPPPGASPPRHGPGDQPHA
ncbi:protein Smaug homolog 2-like [Athene noctua]|uniref:protein Smaug homolog 2-like n=1 Tax=Athene noctua TaxID=126797 RepID=UPI003EBAC501